LPHPKEIPHWGVNAGKTDPCAGGARAGGDVGLRWDAFALSFGCGNVR